jgi:hypothetical protein
LKKSLNQYVNEMMNDKIKNALNVEDSNNEIVDPIPDLNEERVSTVVTTQEELECFFVIRNILRTIVPYQDITYKDTNAYFGIIYKNNVRKWICRIIVNKNQIILMIPDENKNIIKYEVDDIYKIENYKNELIKTLKYYLPKESAAIC